MPVDTSFYSQIGRPAVQLDDPVNRLAQLGQFQGMQNQNRLAQLQISQATQADSDRNALAGAYREAYNPQTGQLDNTKLIGNLANAGAGAAIPGAQKAIAESQKAQREAEKANLEQAIQKQALVSQYAGSATDQASWTAARNAVQQLGIDVSQVPEQFDPAVAKQLQQRALTGVQQLDQHWKQLGYDLDVRKQAEIERDNSTKNSIARGQLGVAQGQLGLGRQRLAFEQSQPKGVYDKDNGIIVDPRTGKSMPVTDQNGQPIQGGGGKMTEDQGKATGWLIQAENAYKNIQSAVKSTPSALKPGVNDFIANIPSFGLGAAAGNSMRGEDRQKVIQATSALSEALLRAATGAGMNENEARQKVNELTPVPGDSDAVIAQKMASIPLYIESLKVRAGPGAKKAAEVMSKQPTAASPASSDGWSVTEVK